LLNVSKQRGLDVVMKSVLSHVEESATAQSRAEVRGRSRSEDSEQLNTDALLTLVQITDQTKWQLVAVRSPGAQISLLHQPNPPLNHPFHPLTHSKMPDLCRGKGRTSPDSS